MKIERPLTHALIGADGEVEQIVSPDGYEGEDLRPLPAGFHDRPSYQWRWSKTDQDWREDVDGERLRLWATVKVQRAELTAAGCDVPEIGRVDTDPASLAWIEQRWGAAYADPEHWSAVWTMADNRREPVDHDAMRSIKLAVDAHIDAIRSAADAVYEDLFDEEITTLAALFAVGIDLTERIP